jgi:hypothetical protein
MTTQRSGVCAPSACARPDICALAVRAGAAHGKTTHHSPNHASTATWPWAGDAVAKSNQLAQSNSYLALAAPDGLAALILPDRSPFAPKASVVVVFEPGILPRFFLSNFKGQRLSSQVNSTPSVAPLTRRLPLCALL